jgi:outer membrane protein assembly factor BamD
MPKMSSRSHAGIVILAAMLAGCGGGNRYQNMDAEGLFQAAQNELAQGDEDNALLALDRLVAVYPNWGRIPEARLLQAQAYYAKGEYLTARSEYQRFRDRYVGNPHAADAALGECQSLAALSPIPQRDQSSTEEAITICANVAVDFSGTPQAAQALELRAKLHHTMAEKDFLNAEHYYRRKQYDPAIIYFQYVVDNYGDTEYAPRALLGIYRSNLAIGYDDLADDAKTKLVTDYPDSPEAAEVQNTGSAP